MKHYNGKQAMNNSNMTGRIAVFRMHKGRLRPQLVLKELWEDMEQLPEFSHWGTPEFKIDCSEPESFNDDNRPPKRYA